MLLLLLAALAAAPESKDLQFLKDLSETRSWRLGRPTAVKVTPDGSRVLFLRTPPRAPDQRFYSFEVATGQARELVAPEQRLKGGEEQLSVEERARRERMRVRLRGFTSYDLSDDGSLVLLTLSGRAYVVPSAGGAAREVAGPDAAGNPLLDPRLSPDGHSVSFVRGGELWVAPVAGGPALALTAGATPARTHAVAEFVAQEELNRFTGYWWSPDSRFLCYEEADLSAVEKLDFTDAAHPERPAGESRYPQPGKPNAKLAFGVVPAAGGPTVWLDYDHARWEYVAKVIWSRGGPLTLSLLSRDQKDLLLVAADPATGKTRELLREHDEAWLNADHDAEWLRDGSGLLWSTERNGAWQLELRGPGGALVKTLTAPDFGYAGIVAVQAEAHAVIVYRAVRAVDDQLWSVPLGGGEARPVAAGPDLYSGGWARDSAAHVLTTQGANGPPRHHIFRADGSEAGTLPSVSEAAPFETRLEVAQAAGFWTALIRPHGFDPKRKYPVLLSVYGGPHARTVLRNGDAYLADQWIADHGFIVAHADGRGTPGRGRAWERAIEKKFAEVPLEDQVAALRALAQREPAMDLSRVGVMGHSFGGFMAALAVLRRPDVFRAAVSGAPVADWLSYDTCYTERYLGVPPPAGTSDAYPRNGLLGYVKDASRPILLMHGTADDNVHFSNTLLLEDALFREGHSGLVSLLPFAGQTHQFYEPALMLRYWQRVFGFLDNELR